jgi:hypothetical protein
MSTVFSLFALLEGPWRGRRLLNELIGPIVLYHIDTHITRFHNDLPKSTAPHGLFLSSNVSYLYEPTIDGHLSSPSRFVLSIPL